MSPRVLAILIGLFVVLAAGGVMLIPGGDDETGSGAPGVLQPGDRGVPGRSGGGRGRGLMMNSGDRSIAAPTQPVPTAQERGTGSGPGFASGSQPRRALPDRTVRDESGETRGPIERERTTTVRRPQAQPTRTPTRGVPVERVAAERNAEIARAQAIRDAQQRARMAQRNRAAAQRAAGRQNAEVVADNTGQDRGESTQTVGGTGTAGTGGGGPTAGGGSGGPGGTGGSGASAGGGGRGGTGGTGSSGGGQAAGLSTGGGGGGGSGGGGLGPTVGGVPNVTVTAEFREVAIDTSACPELEGHRSVDLFLVFSQSVGVLTVDSSGADRIVVEDGALVQAEGGGNGPPNPGLVAGSPCLEFDSYFDLGGVPLSFATGPTLGGSASQTVTAVWFTISPAQTTLRSGQHELRVGRFTAPTTITDITGAVSVGYTTAGLAGAPSTAVVTLPSVASVFTGEPPAAGGGVEPADGEEPEEPELLFGACCLPGQVCEGELSAGACEALGGVYQGNGTSCADVTCDADPGTNPGTDPGGGGGEPEPGDDPDRPGEGEPEEPGLGSCWLPSGACEPRTEASCDADFGIYDPNGDCPTQGACVVAENGMLSCSQMTQEDCAIMSGQFLGLGTTCTQAVWVVVADEDIECEEIAAIPNLGGTRTFDLYLRLSAPRRILIVESNPISSHITIDGGLVYQHPAGSNRPSNPNLFVPFPCLEFDSYLALEGVVPPVTPTPENLSIEGLSASGGTAPLSESTWTGVFGAFWFLTPQQAPTAGQNEILFGNEMYHARIARFTLPAGVNAGGALNAFVTPAAGSGQTAQVTGIPVPTVSGP